jgi:dipeptidyl aminopeptidase/acylaminoacyl peptidase
MRLAEPQPRSLGAAGASVVLLSVLALGARPSSLPEVDAALAKGKVSVGHVTAVKRQWVAVGGHRLEPDGVPYEDDHVYALHAGDRLSATSHGRVWFEVQRGDESAYCLMRPRQGASRVRVSPSPKVLLNFTAGRLQCSTSPSGGKKTIRIRDVTMETVDPVFEVLAGKKQVVVKLRRGVAVVKGREGKGVVLGLNGRHAPRFARQVVVPRGRAPRPPTTVSLAGEERAAFTRLAAKLPPLRDASPPTTELVTRPPNTSGASVRFTFKSSEAGVVFSCALDGGRAGVCSSPRQYTDLSAGVHRFSVRATDGAGNTGPVATYSWTVIKSAPAGIAFASNRAGSLDVFVIDPDGKRPLKRLTTSGALDDDPEWSFDGTRIAFHSERDRNSEIYVMRADGNAQERLTTNSAQDRNPTWSPDGTRIAFESYRDDGKTREIYVMNADGSAQRRLTTNGVDDLDPSWSPDGRTIAFASERDGNREIYVMNADGSMQTRLTTTTASEFNPEWSPNGTRLAFHTDRDGNYEIYVMNRDGTGQMRLTASPGQDYNPTWSPSGIQIAFQSDRDGNFEIYVMGSNGSAQTRLTKDQAVDQVPDW